MLDMLDYIFRMDFLTLFTGFFTIGFSIILLISHHVLTKKNKGARGWKIWSALCFVPLILCAVHFYFSSFKGMESFSIKLYLPMYSASLILVILCLLRNRKILYTIVSVLVVLASLAGFGYMIFKRLAKNQMGQIGNFSRCSYVESFDLIMADMQQHYVMNEWKDIDYDEIRACIMPKVEEAERNNDPKAYYAALLEYVNMFHDGHMSITGFSEEGMQIVSEVNKELAGNDYGFALFTVDSGETIAILVEEGSAAEQGGISFGTVITKWNGVDIDEAIEGADYFLGTGAPVKANFDRVKAMYFPGLSEGRIEVSFIGNDSKEKTISLDSIGNYSKRLNLALSCFVHNVLIGTFDRAEYMSLSDEEKNAFKAQVKAVRENYRTKMLSDDCGYIVFNSESYDDVGDVIASAKDEYPEIKELVNSKLEDLRAQGMEHLIIDTRNNTGGLSLISRELVSLFTDHEIAMEMSGQNSLTVKVDGRWSDLDVIVLTNMKCCSSGDGLIYAFLQCPNVTVMGMTNSMGIYQAIGGVCITPDSVFSLNYPIIPTYDSDGVIMIDTRSDRVTRMPVDVMIPVTLEACEIIFDGDDDTDYEVDYALDYFRNI